MIIRVNDNGTLKTFNVLDGSVVADAFDATESYAVGDYCIYGNSLYRFISAHSGVWSASDATAVAIAEELANAGAKTVTVSGTIPTITAEENTRYICGEVTSLSFTPCASGICDVRFTSGSTVTVLTIPNTVKFPDWFNPSSLETNTVYEINVLDGVYGVVTTWAV